MQIRKSKKARKLRITVKYTGEVIVTVPAFVSIASAERFVAEKADWIQKARERVSAYTENKTILKQSKKDFHEHKQRALEFVLSRIALYNQHYQFKHNDIRVKNQLSRWGSCSSKGNLNFNYGIIRLPLHLADYIVVHELCHLKEMNHGTSFWNLVGETIPDYKARRLELKKNYVHIS